MAGQYPNYTGAVPPVLPVPPPQLVMYNNQPGAYQPPQYPGTFFKPPASGAQMTSYAPQTGYNIYQIPQQPSTYFQYNVVPQTQQHPNLPLKYNPAEQYHMQSPSVPNADLNRRPQLLQKRAYSSPMYLAKGDFTSGFQDKLSQKEKLEALIADDPDYSQKCERLYRKFAVLFHVYGPMDCMHEKIMNRFLQLSGEDRKFVMRHGCLERFLVSSEYFDLNDGLIVLKRDVSLGSNGFEEKPGPYPKEGDKGLLGEEQLSGSVPPNNEESLLLDLEELVTPTKVVSASEMTAADGSADSAILEKPYFRTEELVSESAVDSETTCKSSTVSSPVESVQDLSEADEGGKLSSDTEKRDRALSGLCSGEKLYHTWEQDKKEQSERESLALESPPLRTPPEDIDLPVYEDWGDGLDYSLDCTVDKFYSLPIDLGVDADEPNTNREEACLDHSQSTFELNAQKHGIHIEYTNQRNSPSDGNTEISSRDARDVPQKIAPENSCNLDGDKCESVQDNKKQAVFENDSILNETSQLEMAAEGNTEQISLSRKHHSEQSIFSHLNSDKNENGNDDCFSKSLSLGKVNSEKDTATSNLHSMKSKNKFSKNSIPPLKTLATEVIPKATSRDKISYIRSLSSLKSISPNTISNKTPNSVDTKTLSKCEDASSTSTDMRLIEKDVVQSDSEKCVKESKVVSDGRKCLSEGNAWHKLATALSHDLEEKDEGAVHKLNTYFDDRGQPWDSENHNAKEENDGATLDYCSNLAVPDFNDDLDCSLYHSMSECYGKESKAEDMSGTETCVADVDVEEDLQFDEVDGEVYMSPRYHQKIGDTQDDDVNEGNGCLTTNKFPKKNFDDGKSFDVALENCRRIVKDTVTKSLDKVKQEEGVEVVAPISSDVQLPKQRDRQLTDSITSPVLSNLLATKPKLSPLAPEFKPTTILSSNDQGVQFARKDLPTSLTSRLMRDRSLSLESVLQESPRRGDLVPVKTFCDMGVNTSEDCDQQNNHSSVCVSVETQTGPHYGNLVKRASSAEKVTVQLQGKLLSMMLKQEFQASLRQLVRGESGDMSRSTEQVIKKYEQECKKLQTQVSFHISALDRGITLEELPQLEVYFNLNGQQKNLCVDAEDITLETEDLGVDDCIMYSETSNYSRSEVPDTKQDSSASSPVKLEEKKLTPDNLKRKRADFPSSQSKELELAHSNPIAPSVVQQAASVGISLVKTVSSGVVSTIRTSPTPCDDAASNAQSTMESVPTSSHQASSPSVEKSPAEVYLSAKAETPTASCLEDVDGDQPAYFTPPSEIPETRSSHDKLPVLPSHLQLPNLNQLHNQTAASVSSTPARIQDTTHPQVPTQPPAQFQPSVQSQPLTQPSLPNGIESLSRMPAPIAGQNRPTCTMTYMWPRHPMPCPTEGIKPRMQTQPMRQPLVQRPLGIPQVQPSVLPPYARASGSVGLQSTPQLQPTPTMPNQFPNVSSVGSAVEQVPPVMAHTAQSTPAAQVPGQSAPPVDLGYLKGEVEARILNKYPFLSRQPEVLSTLVAQQTSLLLYHMGAGVTNPGPIPTAGPAPNAFDPNSGSSAQEIEQPSKFSNVCTTSQQMNNNPPRLPKIASAIARAGSNSSLASGRNSPLSVSSSSPPPVPPPPGLSSTDIDCVEISRSRSNSGASKLRKPGISNVYVPPNARPSNSTANKSECEKPPNTNQSRSTVNHSDPSQICSVQELSAIDSSKRLDISVVKHQEREANAPAVLSPSLSTMTYRKTGQQESVSQSVVNQWAQKGSPAKFTEAETKQVNAKKRIGLLPTPQMSTSLGTRNPRAPLPTHLPSQPTAIRSIPQPANASYNVSDKEQNHRQKKPNAVVSFESNKRIQPSSKPLLSEEEWDVDEYPELRVCGYDPHRQISYGMNDSETKHSNAKKANTNAKAANPSPVNVPGLTGAMLEGIRRQAARNKEAAQSAGNANLSETSNKDRKMGLWEKTLAEKNQSADMCNPNLTDGKTSPGCGGKRVDVQTETAADLDKFEENTEESWTQVIKKKKKDQSQTVFQQQPSKQGKKQPKKQMSKRTSGPIPGPNQPPKPLIPGLTGVRYQGSNLLSTSGFTFAKTMSEPIKQSNFENLVGAIQSRYPQFSRGEVTNVIKEVRTKRGALSGMGIPQIVELCRPFLQKRQPDSVDNKNMVFDDDEDACVICYEALSLGVRNRLECGHEYHDHCIKRWVFGQERTCPTCRQLALFPEEFPKLGK